MTSILPDYLGVVRSCLGKDQSVQVQVAGDMDSMARHMANAMLDEIEHAQSAGRSVTMIVPVGPVDQFPILAGMINEKQIDCRDVMIINMDEYLTDDDQLLGLDHPLSLLGYMNRKFYDLVSPALAPISGNRVYPRPDDPASIAKLIKSRGGVDVCFGGIGINGHIAFNEPPEPGIEMSVEQFAGLSTRCLDVSRETRAINSNTVGGEISIVPKRCVTVGMKEILAANRLRFYCNRPWQAAVVRRVLHGPVSATCPASLLRIHHDASITVTDFVAEVPDIRLR